MPNVPTSQLDLNGEIWHFALDLYHAPGVSEICLQLQDEAGFDVVNAIVILYAEAKLHRRLTADQVQQLESETRNWRDETVLPLRYLRRRLRVPPPNFPASDTEDLRNQIKKAELQSEQIQIAMCERWLSAIPAADGLAAEAALRLLLKDPSDASSNEMDELIDELVGAAAKAIPAGT